MTAALQLDTDHWRYLHGSPTASGKIKCQPEDFQVRELPAYELSGEGEHLYLWVRKVDLNTAFVAERLAQYCQLPLRAVSYAGRKDKFAQTEQYFALHLPGKADPNWSKLNLPGVEIIHAGRHNKKLRTGSLQGNRFVLTVRDIENAESLPERLAKISQTGVPNYFGEQRFGNGNSNLQLARRMIAGEQIRNRNKRSLCISALRSWLFNEVVSARLSQAPSLTDLLPGDALMLSGSNSFFIAEQADPQLIQRLSQGDLLLSAPLWGKGECITQLQAALLEEQVVSGFPEVTGCLENLNLRQERRSLRLIPTNMDWKIDDNIMTISFDLPSGCFATSVLRELLHTEDSHIHHRKRDENTAQ